MNDRQKYLSLLSEKNPPVRSLSREIINLTAIMNLPKDTDDGMKMKQQIEDLTDLLAEYLI